jgi:hypothetical protein
MLFNDIAPSLSSLVLLAQSEMQQLSRDVGSRDRSTGMGGLLVLCHPIQGIQQCVVSSHVEHAIQTALDL